MEASGRKLAANEVDDFVGAWTGFGSGFDCRTALRSGPDPVGRVARALLLRDDASSWRGSVTSRPLCATR